MTYKDQLNAIVQAKTWLDKKPLFLDTETTGLDDLAEICDIAVIDHDGVVVFDTLIKPTIAIPESATAVHGIDDQMVANSPTFADIAGRLETLLTDRCIVIYNAEFDLRLIEQSCSANALTDRAMISTYMDHILDQTVCAMTMYAAFYGDWNDYHGNYRWQSLSTAAYQCGLPVPPDLHRARADAELTRQVVHYVADYKFKEEDH